MTNTSATGGYLVPSSTSVAIGPDLDRQLSQMVRGIVGLPDGMVRPRWQPVPPKQPAPDQDWAAIGVTVLTPDYGTYNDHHSDGAGSTNVQRHETVDVLASFYGPNAMSNAARLRDGLSVAQNRETLGLQGIVLLEAGRIVNASELVDTQWIGRFDLSLRFRREIDRVYPILNIEAAPVSLEPEPGAAQSFLVTEN